MRDPWRDQLRREVRQRRRALTAQQRYAAAVAARNAAAASGVLRPGARIGVYLAVRGELDTGPIIELARRRGCRLFVPIIDQPRRGDLRFGELTGALQANRVGILEPRRWHKAVSGRSLDVVLVPIVAFGPRGERLGTGGGYYDRAFAYLRHRVVWSKPQLVGLAYHWQRADALTSRHWDVSLTAVITDRGVVRFPHRATGTKP